MERHKLDDWARIAEIVGAIAIVISLLYVAFELRENNRILQVNSRQVLSNQDLMFFESAIDPSVIAIAIDKAERGEALSDLEWSQLERRQSMNFRIFEHAFYLYRSGALELSEWERYQRIIRNNICSNPSAQRLWSRSGTSWDPDFRQEVENESQKCSH